jgi:hypothetical protein
MALQHMSDMLLANTQKIDRKGFFAANCSLLIFMEKHLITRSENIFWESWGAAVAQ